MGGRGLRLRWVKPLLWREIRNLWVTKLIGTPFYRFFKVGVYPKILQIHWVLRIAREVRDALVLAKTKKKRGRGVNPNYIIRKVVFMWLMKKIWSEQNLKILAKNVDFRERGKKKHSSVPCWHYSGIGTTPTHSPTLKDHRLLTDTGFSKGRRKARWKWSNSVYLSAKLSET